MEKYMRRAIELAKRGTGFVNPNPLVGAVIVKNGKIIGEGYHERYGEPHAERNALKNCSISPVGADMYVTLEPCCHYGKNPPCTEAVIASGIKRVFVGSCDPNPLVAGIGIDVLRKSGIEVTEGVLKDECDTLNSIFFHFITTGTPYVIMKTAVTADGKTAAVTGDARWITNELSRANTHQTRKLVSAILVGVNTVIADDPLLNCRAYEPSNPLRVICDSTLRIPLTSKILATARDIPTLVATVSSDKDKISAIENTGAQVIKTKMLNNRVDIADLMQSLGNMKIDSVLIEGGGEIHASALKAGIVNKVQIYIAPKIMGGDGKNSVASLDVTLAADALKLGRPEITRFGDDILLEYEVVHCLRE